MRQDAAKQKRRAEDLPKAVPCEPRKAKAFPPKEAPLDGDELAFLLQIDLVLGREKTFLRRLKQALAERHA